MTAWLIFIAHASTEAVRSVRSRIIFDRRRRFSKMGTLSRAGLL